RDVEAVSSLSVQCISPLRWIRLQAHPPRKIGGRHPTAYQTTLTRLCSPRRPVACPLPKIHTSRVGQPCEVAGSRLYRVSEVEPGCCPRQNRQYSVLFQYLCRKSWTSGGRV